MADGYRNWPLSSTGEINTQDLCHGRSLLHFSVVSIFFFAADEIVPLHPAEAVAPPPGNLGGLVPLSGRIEADDGQCRVGYFREPRTSATIEGLLAEA